MDSKALGMKLRQLRLKNGLSQDELAQSAGVSLRTVQRMENAEATPRMDTIKRLYQVFDLNPDEVLDYSPAKDKGYLLGMNLSGLVFVLIPLLGVIIPIIFWMSRKDKISGINEVGRHLVNFQLTWAALYFVGLTINRWFIQGIMSSGDIQPSVILNGAYLAVFIKITIWLIVIGMILWNTGRISKGRPVKYFTAINFLR